MVTYGKVENEICLLGLSINTFQKCSTSVCLYTHIYIYIRGDEMNQTEYMWKKINKRKIYTWCSWWFIYLSIFANACRLQNLPVHKIILSKNYFKHENQIKQLYQKKKFSCKSKVIIWVKCFGFTQTSNTGKIYSKLITSSFLKKGNIVLRFENKFLTVYNLKCQEKG